MTVESRFSPATAVAVVVANMIGTGVFTSLGFQLLEIQSGFVILMLWAVGGVAALCGALCYAELGAALPRSGGEYNFLGRIYHPGVGFVSGWISATIGFAAPTALAAITFGTYLSSVFTSLSPVSCATALVIGLTLVHMWTRRSSGGVQRWFTGLKVAFIAVFCLLVLLKAGDGQPVSFLPASGDGALLTSGAFAVALIYVSYAYTGWNAVTYLSSELREPQRVLPLVLTVGTAAVALAYVLLNFTFLYAAPIDAMAGELEVGYVAARHVFGERGAAVMGVALALLLVSTVSAMIMAGPRVLQVIGEDFSAFRMLSRTNSHGLPSVAVAAQSALALAFIWTASFESILVFAGFTLGLSTFLTVLGLFVLRIRRPGLPRPYRLTAYPLPALVYLAIAGWTLAYILLERPQESLMGLALIGAGAAFYGLTRMFERTRH
ncbi:MAG: amino acid permease [Gammaproteobacteria bacterium]|nr:amino acid permease [Gammaproteobacteria bacterium]